MDKLFSDRNTSIISAGVFLCYLAYRLVLVFFPQPDIGGVENNVIWFIQRLLNGEPLYTNPEATPFSIAQYAPLYYYLTAAVGKVVGVNPDNVLSVFILSRLISLLLNLVYAGLVMKTAGKLFNASFNRSIISGVFTFIFLEILSFSRPDSLSHLLFFAAFYFFGVFLKQEKENINQNKYLLLASIFSVAAVFAKQSAIILPLVFMVWLIRQRRIRPLFLFGSSCIIVTTLLLVVIHLESGLFACYQNTVLGINNGISLFWFWNNIIKEFYRQFGLLWVPLLFIIIIVFKKHEKAEYRFTSFCLLLCFVFSNLFALKFGSSPGYFTEWCGIVFASMWVLVAKTDIPPGIKKSYSYYVNVLIITILTIKILLISYPAWEKIRPGAKGAAFEQYYNDRRVAMKLSDLLKAKPGTFVFNNIYSPDSYLNNFLFRQTVLPQFEVVIFGTWNNKVFEYSNFRESFKNGTVQYLLVKPNQTKNFMDITMDNYKPADTLNGYPIYKYEN